MHLKENKEGTVEEFWGEKKKKFCNYNYKLKDKRKRNIC